MSGFWLKILAMISMLIDHTGMVLFPQMQGLRVLGRLAFPLYCFLLAEGAVHTSNSKRYLGRLLGFALLSEIPFDLACHNTALWMQSQNVFFTLFLGLAACALLEPCGGGRAGGTRRDLADRLRGLWRGIGDCLLYLPDVSREGNHPLYHPQYRLFAAQSYDAPIGGAGCCASDPALQWAAGKSTQQIRVLLGVSHPFVAFVFPAPVPDVVGLERAAGKFVRFLDKMESCGGRCCVLSAERI